MGVDSIETLAPRPMREPNLLLAAKRLLLPRTAPLSVGGQWFVFICVAALAATALTDLLHVFLGLAPSWDGALQGPVVGVADVVAAASVLLSAATAKRDRAVWWLAA